MENTEKNENIEMEKLSLLNPENETDNIEYKSILKDDSPENLVKIGAQIIRRLHSDTVDGYSNGEAIYYIGINDDGSISEINIEEYTQSVEILDKALAKINCVKMMISHKIYDKKYHVGEFLIREENIKTPIEIVTLMAGSVDAGKSSTIGCLISGERDNGRGKSRMSVFTNKDEITTGRTMIIAHHIMGITSQGVPVRDLNYSWTDIMKKSSKIVKFIDLAGHEKYSKSTYKGYTLMKGNICLIMVGANMGINDITKEHIFLCLNLKIPFAFVLTKIDLCNNRMNVLEETLQSIKGIMSLPSLRKQMFIVKTDEDVVTCAKNIYSLSIVPVFKMSNVTFEGMDNLIGFLNLIPQKKNIVELHHDNTVEMYIDSTFQKKGFNCIVGGQLISGSVKTGDKLYIGPNSIGEWRTVSIKSIHYNRTNVEETFNNTYYCFGITGIKRNEVKKGMVLVDNNPVSFMEFTAKIYINQITRKYNDNSRYNSRSISIKVGYEPNIHIMNIRQNVKIINISDKVTKRENSDPKILMYGDSAVITCRCKFKPQYITPGQKVLFTEGFLMGIGTVLSVGK